MLPLSTSITPLQLVQLLLDTGGCGLAGAPQILDQHPIADPEQRFHQGSRTWPWPPTRPYRTAVLVLSPSTSVTLQGIAK